MSVDVHGCLDVFMSESFLIVAPASNEREQWVCLNPRGVILLKSGYFSKHLKINLLIAIFLMIGKRYYTTLD